MVSNLSLIEGAYLQDLLEQPAALRRTLDGLYEAGPVADVRKLLSARPIRQAVLTGMGSSLHALYPICYQLNRKGIRTLMVETSELLYSLPEILDPETLPVVVSQSGRSVEVVRLIERPEMPPFVGVTNTPDSPLARQAAAAVLTRAGDEFSVSCKTYVAGLVALQWLADVLCGVDLAQSRARLAQAEAATAKYLANWKEHVAALVNELKGVRDVFIAGRGASLATAGTGGLILKESTHMHAEGMSSPAFRHGPMEMLSDGVFVMVCAGDAETEPLNRRLVEDIVSAGGRAVLAGPEADNPVFRLPDLPVEVRPVVEILPVQMISLTLGLLTGHEPGKFSFATKVTTIE